MPRLLSSGLAMAMLLAGASSHAAEESVKPAKPAKPFANKRLSQKNEVTHLIQQLSERVSRLEQRNSELEKQLQAKSANADNAITASPASPANVALEPRVQALEAGQSRIDQALESERISEKESELVTRLKVLEAQTVHTVAAARRVEALDGISAGLSLTTVAQKPPGSGTGGHSQLNYRGDATLQVPLGKVGNAEQKVFVQFRMGQGDAVQGAASSFSNPNASAFQAGGGLRSDDTVATLAQAWYQTSIPLPLGGHQPNSKEKLEITFGKLDPFAFFDQNAVAGDETKQFLNSLFVHNPLLDAGGQFGSDANGFAPGFKVEYSNFGNKPETWRVSLGAFGTGPQGATYQRSLANPLLIVQAETEQRWLGGLLGAYRVYVWRNPQGAHFDSTISATERHTGWGASVNQRVGDGVNLFGRYGHQIQGHVAFDRALTLGAEFNGSYWGQAGDTLGVAAGYLRTSPAYRASLSNPAHERVAELYYRYRINKQFELSPNWQYIDNPGGERAAQPLKLLGLRAQITY